MNQTGPPPERGAFRGGAVDWELLADHLGGALAGTADEDRVAHLVATDPAWACAAEALARGLDAVADDLTALPAPTMPPDVTDRIAAALRADSPQAGQPDTATAAAAGATAAGTAAAGRTGGVPSPRSRRGGGGRPPTRPGDHRRPATRAGGRATGRRAAGWAAGLVTAAAAVVAVAMVGIGDLGLNVSGGDDGAELGAAEDQSVAPQAGPRLVATGTDYLRSALAADAVSRRPDPLAPAPAMEPRISTENDVDGSGEGPDGPDSLNGLSVDPSLHAIWLSPRPCLAEIEAAVAPAPARVEVVDFARFEGEPALIAWVATGDGGTAVLVAGTGCGQPGAGADVRYRTGG